MTLLLSACLISTVRAEISVIEDTRSALVIGYRSEGWSELITETGTVPYPRGASIDDRESGRMVPFYRRLIGLPAGIKPGLRILDQRWSGFFRGLPPRGIQPDSLLPVQRLDTAPAAMVGEPFIYRNRWVAYLYIVPLRIEGSSTRRLEEMRLRIEYPKRATRLVRRDDPLALKALLNPRAASGWALPPRRSELAKQREIAGLAAWPAGTMIRIETGEEGIYEITYEELEANGFDLSGFDPRTFRLYGNGGFMLDPDPLAGRDSMPRENAIIAVGESDGSWDPGDRILFHGKGVNSWTWEADIGEYTHTHNPYTTFNVYWLNIPDDGSQGSRMQQLGASGAYAFTANRARSRLAVDNDVLIFNDSWTPASGVNWYAMELYGGDRYSTNFQVESPVGDQTATLRYKLKRYGGTPLCTIQINNTTVQTASISSLLQTVEIPAGLLVSGQNSFSIIMTSGHGYFDWFEISYTRSLETTSGRIDFDRLPSEGVGEISLTGLSNPWIFDIYDFDHVKYTRDIPFTVESGDIPHRYIAVSNDNFLHPHGYRESFPGGPGYPDGLRATDLAADYLYISHSDFLDAAASLKQHVEQRDNVNILLVDISDVFDEFSWGLFDPTAIRDFLKYAVESWNGPPSVCLLIGDGDYDYRNIVSSADRNWIPPYENGTDCRDDFYATFGSATPELIMGRLPVQTSYELEAYIEKLTGYDNQPVYDPWRSRMVLVADDEHVDTGPTSHDQEHMRQAESIADQHTPDYLDVEKIYIGSYPTAFDPVSSGRLKPLATRELIECINRGALLVSYIGHGNAHVWAHESVFLDTRDRTLINSGKKTPVYVAFTCSWGHFDRPENEAFFEDLIVSPGGAVGVIAATRNTVGQTNFALSLDFYDNIFNRSERYGLGESLYFAKLDNYDSWNRYYHCFAEPMFVPAVPREDVVVTSLEPDSLVSLASASIEGEIRSPEGVPHTGFDGETLVTVYDGADLLNYTFIHYISDPSTGARTPVYTPFEYTMPGGTIFRGLVNTVGGRFRAQFLVPRDVNFGSSSGWVQMYAFNDDGDGIGSKGNVAISTTSASSDDRTAPEIEIFFDHRRWRDGDMASPSPQLIVDIADSSGINLTGEIGHDIRAVIDGTEEIVLTDDFIYSRDSHTTGTVEQRLYGIAPGEYKIEIWAWDNVNNYARKEVRFTLVDASSEVVLRDVLNWPNPFSDNTSFTFELSAEAEVSIRIFTASGRLVREIGPVSANAGYNYPEATSRELVWNGRDLYGDSVANGVYLYRITATGASGQSDEKLGKLIRIR